MRPAGVERKHGVGSTSLGRTIMHARTTGSLDRRAPPRAVSRYLTMRAVAGNIAKEQRSVPVPRGWEIARCGVNKDQAPLPPTPSLQPRYNEDGELLPIDADELRTEELRTEELRTDELERAEEGEGEGEGEFTTPLSHTAAPLSSLAVSLALSRTVPGEGVGLYRGWFAHPGVKSVAISWGEQSHDPLASATTPLASELSPAPSPRNHAAFLVYQLLSPCRSSLVSADRNIPLRLQGWSSGLERAVVSGRLPRSATLGEIMDGRLPGDLSASTSPSSVYVYVR